jgi:hypothetical protein
VKNILSSVSHLSTKLMPVFLIVGFIISTFGMYWLIDIKKSKPNGLSASGVVVNIISDSGSSSSGETVFFPVVEFKNHAGMAITFKDKQGSNPPLYERGDNVSVVYNPDRPGQALIEKGALGMFPALFCLAFGVLILWSGVHGFLDVRSRPRSVNP